MRDQSRQSPRSVSGPTSSGSFALTLIRGSPQRAIHGTVRLARRPAELAPDQYQGSAVTYVAICVVSATAIKKYFLSTVVRRSASHAVLDALRPLCGASRHMLVLRVSEIRARLKAPFRPSATDSEGSK
ncbi:dGTP triphosphohydrolase [Pseudomonas syringae pv. actinidiae]|uniref:dGTP triphosphohydrolase n=1 Tax=Pseudomonas syringae pv. actinidiae TaxID=103796 RepID=A0A2V0Q852_PSESF|nr:dGTP triphosphohydrolase [Pseudomonas syringae pv. actinidiae]